MMTINAITLFYGLFFVLGMSTGFSLSKNGLALFGILVIIASGCLLVVLSEAYSLYPEWSAFGVACAGAIAGILGNKMYSHVQE